MRRFGLGQQNIGMIMAEALGLKLSVIACPHVRGREDEH